jgi:hypothetical protein
LTVLVSRKVIKPLSDNPVSAKEKQEERRFQLELAKLQSTDSFKTNMALGLYILGATFVLGSFTIPDPLFKWSCLAAGLAFVGTGVAQFSKWQKSRDQKIKDIERDYI